MTLDELGTIVQLKASAYMMETGEKVDPFPSSIVDWVVEYAISMCHFPSDYSEEKIAARLSRCINTLAMCCVETYSRAGAEGEKAHSENAISRTYDGTWISNKLLEVLPNYVGVI